MQCYESEALRLQLYADTRRLTPDTQFDPLALEEVLDEFGVEHINEYNALAPGRRGELARRAGELSPHRSGRSCVA